MLHPDLSALVWYLLLPFIAELPSLSIAFTSLHQIDEWRSLPSHKLRRRASVRLLLMSSDGGALGQPKPQEAIGSKQLLTPRLKTRDRVREDEAQPWSDEELVPEETAVFGTKKKLPQGMVIVYDDPEYTEDGFVAALCRHVPHMSIDQARQLWTTVQKHSEAVAYEDAIARVEDVALNLRIHDPMVVAEAVPVTESLDEKTRSRRTRLKDREQG